MTSGHPGNYTTLTDVTEAREEVLARLDAMEHKLDRLLQVLGQALRSRP